MKKIPVKEFEVEIVWLPIRGSEVLYGQLSSRTIDHDNGSSSQRQPVDTEKLRLHRQVITIEHLPTVCPNPTGID